MANDQHADAGTWHRVLAFIRRLPRRDARLIGLSSIAAALIALLDVLGLGLLLPVLQLLLDPDVSSGPVGALSDLTGITDPDQLALTLGVVAVGSFVLRSLLAMWHAWRNAGLVERINADVTGRLLRSYLAAPYLFHTSRSSSELVRNLRESVNIAVSAGLYMVLQLVADLASVLAITVTLLAVDAPVTIGLALYMALVVWVYQRVVRSRLIVVGQTLSDLTKTEYLVMSQTFGGVRDIYVQDAQAHFEAMLVDNRRALGRTKQRVTFLSVIPRYYLEAALLVGVGLAAASLFATRDTDQALTALALFAAAGFRMLPTAGRTLYGVGVIHSSLPHFDVLGTELDLYEQQPGVDLGEIGTAGAAPLLELRDISFSFTVGTPVLDGVSLTVHAGRSLGIVGSSGAGKTTMLDLMLGLYAAESGEVLVGGRPLSEVARSWRARLGYVSQDVFLLDDTVRRNVAFAVDDDELDDDRVRESVRRADLETWASTLPEGLDTEVGERGVRLSGGQRQRLGLARALYDQPSVLVLDEATSALDVETEARIMETIEDVRQSGTMTTIVVAHRLSTVRRCDEICLLAGGKVVASGSFDDLVRDGGDFAHLALLAGISAGTADGT